MKGHLKKGTARTLTPGMYASAELPPEPTQEMLTIPVQAVRKDGGRQEVLVLDGDNRLRLREVRTGIEGDALVQIVGGLRIGEQVVSDVIETQASEQLNFNVQRRPPVRSPRM